MQWCTHLPHLGRNVKRSHIQQFAIEAERLGCHSIWVSDHICWPAHIQSRYPYSHNGDFLVSPDKDWLDPLNTLAFAAACTERVLLGTSVLILPYRPPVTTAKQIATIDVLSEGRMLLGVGVGWMAEEAQILGMPWDKRGKRSDEQLELLKVLFGEPTPSFKGEFYQLPEVGFEPKPVQRPLPIWVGGSSRAAFERTARYGTGFHAAFQPIDVVEQEWQEVKAACERIGRDASEITLSLRVFLDPAGAMPPAQSIAGSRQQMLDTIGDLQRIGVTNVLLDPVARGGPSARLDAVRAFMQDVAPEFP